MANPFTNLGSSPDIGGSYTLTDLYRTYMTYGYLTGMGEDTFTFNNEDWGLTAYDTFSEDNLRKTFREDYLDIVSDISNLYATERAKNVAGRGEIGRTGVTGGAFSRQYDKSAQTLETGVTGLAESLSLKRTGLINQITGIREDYEEDIFGAGPGSVYSAFQASGLDPHIHADEITSCYNEGKLWAGNPDNVSQCIDASDIVLPEDWGQPWSEYDAIRGCTDPQANNYNANAVYDNGSCDYTTVDIPEGWEYQEGYGTTACPDGYSWDDEEQQCEEIVYAEDWDEIVDEYEETGSGFEEESYTFDAGGETWNIICPEGMVPHTNVQGESGCIEEGTEYNVFTGYWTEEDNMSSNFDQDEYDTFVASGMYTYEEWFGGPSEVGYTDYYCAMHPLNPNC